MRKERAIPLNTALSILAEQAMDLLEKGHHLFIEYSPHVNWVTIYLHVGGWCGEDSKPPTVNRTAYLDENNMVPAKWMVETLREIRGAVAKAGQA